MKNTTYATVYSFLTSNGFDNAEILAEFEKELNRGAEAKQAKEAKAQARAEKAKKDKERRAKEKEDKENE